MGARPRPRCISLLTDFGMQDAYVGVMKGVVARIAPGAEIIDLCHELPPQRILPGALLLRGAVRFFPPGTVHLAVVDPGVGSGRRALVVETRQALFVGPDNGLLWPAATALGFVRARAIENRDLFLHPVSRTFHGRDIFAPVAAHLAAGLPPSAVGPEIDDPERLEVPEPETGPGGTVSGQVLHVDRFGNLITNIGAAAIAGAQGCFVRVGPARRIPVVDAYAQVPEGRLLAIVGSWDLLEVAVRNGNAAQMLGAGVGSPVGVSPAPRSRTARRGQRRGEGGRA